MSDDQAAASGPDFTEGIALSAIPDGGMLAGQAFGKAVLLVRNGDEVFAVAAHCTHYGAPLADGIVVGDTVRCPWHHACFRARDGEAVRAPALAPLARFELERLGDTVRVTRECAASDGATPASARTARAGEPSSVVILGGGAAGAAAAEMLRREGYTGPVTLLTADTSAPYDRPNLSKDYLAGTASEDWIPLRPGDFYAEHDIRLVLARRATALDAAQRQVTLDDGTTLAYGSLLLATGAAPVRLPDAYHHGLPVHYLRSLDDSRAIIAAAKGATRVVVLGASFIGLEVAASLVARGIEVHVVGPELHPLERVLGAQVGDAIRALHEEHGVVFHLGGTAREIAAREVLLQDGGRIAADFVVAGIGVRPDLSLAERAGLRVDNGVVVDAYLQASAPGVYAAGDIARWPDPHSGQRIRVEHWAVAQWQGQAAARNMLGQRSAFDAVPFFWSRHYDMSVHYVGHAERWDDLRVDGDLRSGDWTAEYLLGGRRMAVATAGRERESLRIEAGMEADTRATPVASAPAFHVTT